MQRCERHDIARCTICLGIFTEERYEVPEPTGSVPVHPDPYATNRIPNDGRPAFIHRPHPMYGKPRTEWGTAPSDHPRWNRSAPQTSKTLPNAAPSETLTEWAERLGVTL